MRVTRTISILFTLVLAGLAPVGVLVADTPSKPEGGASRAIEPPELPAEASNERNEVRPGVRGPVRAGSRRTPGHKPGDRGASKGVDAPVARTAPFPNTTIAAETLLEPATVPPLDTHAETYGLPDGRVAVLYQENLRTVSRASVDEGASFAAETILPLASSTFAVGFTAAVDEANGRIYVAQGVADPGGDIGIEVVRSDDFGATWGSPVSVVGSGDPTHGISFFDPRIAANAAGVVALLYRDRPGGDPFAQVSTDSGATWSSAVQLNSLIANDGDGQEVTLALTVSPAGVIHAAFVENRGLGERVFYTRSTDQGASFSTETTFEALFSGNDQQFFPEFGWAAQGNVLLLTFFDSGGATLADRVRVVRSVDDGANFTFEGEFLLNNDQVILAPTLTAQNASALNDTVMLGVIDGRGTLTVRRSTDSGDNWSSPVQLVNQTANNADYLELDQPSIVVTDAGNWAVAWADRRDDSYRGERTDIYARVSTDGGVSFQPERKIDSTSLGELSALGRRGMAATGSDTLFLAYIDARDDSGRSFNIYANRETAANLAAGPPGADNRIDADGTDVAASSLETTAIAVTDVPGTGDDRVYVAFSSRFEGSEAQIRVAVSDDGGQTFPVVNRISGFATFGIRQVSPKIVAEGDDVCVAYNQFNAAGTRWDIHAACSDDGGRSWDAPATRNLSPGGSLLNEFDITRAGDGTVHAVFTDGLGQSILYSQRPPGGSFSGVVTVQNNTSGFNRNPRACATDDTLFVTFATVDLQFAFFTDHLLYSQNNSFSFTTEEQLLPDGTQGGAYFHRLDCWESNTGANGDRAHILMSDERQGRRRDLTAEYYTVGTGQEGEFVVTASPWQKFPGDIVCSQAGDETCVALWMEDQTQTTFEEFLDAVYVARYTQNEGAPPPGTASIQPQRLDGPGTGGAPVPEATNFMARLAADGSVNVWAAWLDQSAGAPELVVRRSNDGGMSFGNTVRVSRTDPQGTLLMGSSEVTRGSFVAARGGRAHYSWAAQRDSTFLSALYSGGNIDIDGDGAVAGQDCDDSDPGATVVPPEVESVTAAREPGGARFSWASLASVAGNGTVYDVIGGPLESLRPDGGFASAACLATGLSAADFLDTQTPAPGNGRYVLIRARNGCGNGTYGDAPVTPDPRDSLDAGASACP